jgi:hypothetical protein
VPLRCGTGRGVFGHHLLLSECGSGWVTDEALCRAWPKAKGARVGKVSASLWPTCC